MAEITFKGNLIHTSGQLPALQSVAPNFILVDKELKDRSLTEFISKYKVIATVPSLDTGVCSIMTKHLSKLSKEHPNVIFMTISADLPFAQNRFCTAENVSNIFTFSMMRNKDFGKEYGVLITDGPLAGILARSVMILDKNNQVIYRELVSELTQEPNFQSITNFLRLIES